MNTQPRVTLTRGPHVDAVVFKVYDEQRAAIIDLRSDLIDYILLPQGISTTLRRFLESESIATIENAANQIRFVGFNLRRPPMDSKEFRQAVATLIDKEFITNVIFIQLKGLPFLCTRWCLKATSSGRTPTFPGSAESVPGSSGSTR